MVIQHNIAGLNALRQMGINSTSMQGNLEKLASGYRINRAADDAAGLSISERMRAQMTGLERARLNAQDGASLIQTAEGALGEVHSMLNRLTELATQAANGTIQASDRQKLVTESDAILAEIDRISQATNFNGINLLDGSLSGSAAASPTVQGVQLGETAAVAGKVSFSALSQQAGMRAGDTLAYTLGTNAGASHTVEFTVSDDLKSITTADGAVYNLGNAAANGEVTIDAAELADAVANELRGTAVADQFIVAASGDGFTLENRSAGTAAVRITGLEEAKNGVHQANVALTSVADAADVEYNISGDAFRLFTGENEQAATFKVNGHSFVLVGAADYEQTVAKLQNRDVNVIEVASENLDAADLKRISADINHVAGTAFEAGADAIKVKMPAGSGGLTMQVGDTAAAHNQVAVTIGNMSSSGLGLSAISLASQESAARALDRISSAIETVSAGRGSLGAMQNRLSYTINNLGVTSENMTAAESRIRDTDMAKMIMQFTKNNVLAQASQAMLAQANTQAQQVLQLLTS
ncbi:MAG: flagellin [Oscillospiraceae bacterium]